MIDRARRFSARLWRWLIERVWGRLAGWVLESDWNAPARLRFLAHLVLVLLLALVVAAASAVALWWALGRPRLAPDAPGPLEPKDLYDGVKIALAVVAGIGGLVALVVAYRKQRFAEREHVRAEAAKVREDTKLFTERFGKAAEQLSSDKAAARLAGVYAMASLADDWKDGRQMCIDVLCAYLRMPYTPPVETNTNQTSDGDAKTAEADEETQRARLEERQVRHTIIRVITQHLREGAPVSWQGHDFDFTGAVFDGGDFTRAMFSGGHVDLSQAVVSGAELLFDSWSDGPPDGLRLPPNWRLDDGEASPDDSAS